MQDVLAIILGGGRGNRLYPLTLMRSKPAVPIGGKYRLIDIPISNCLHAGLRRIFILTQFNSASLNRHVSQSYRMDLFSGGFVDILAAVRLELSFAGILRGAGEGVQQPLSISPVARLTCSQVCREDFSNKISHIQKNADVIVRFSQIEAGFEHRQRLGHLVLTAESAHQQ